MPEISPTARALSAVLAAILLAVSAAPAAAQSPPPAAPLTISVPTHGTVSGSGGLICPTTCNRSFPWKANEVCIFKPTGPICHTEYTPQQVTLTAAADAGWTFDHWGGDCAGTGPCTLTMSTARHADAAFVNPRPTAALDSVPQTVGGVVPVSAAAHDNSAVTRVDFLVDHSPVGSDATGPYGVAWDSRSVADGVHTLGAQAWDDTTQASDESFATVTVDNLAPAVAIVTGPNGQTLGPGTTQAWTFAATDAGSGVGSVQCRIDAGAFGACSTPTSETVTNLPGGTHSLTVRAADRAGHVTEAGRGFTIDAAPPRTTITSGPQDGAVLTATDVTFAFTLSEPGSVQCRVYRTALTPPAFGVCSDPMSHTARGFEPGTYTFDVRAIDLVGNVEPAPASRTFKIVDGGGAGGAIAGGASGHPAVSRSPRIETRLLFLRVANFWELTGATTRLTQLTLGGLPPRTRVTVRCSGHRGACPYHRRAYTARRHRLSLLAPFTGRALPRGTRLTLHLVMPRFGVHEIRFTTRAGAYPRRVDLCPRRHSTRLSACS